MKHILNIIKGIPVVLLCAAVTGCTGDFEAYNTNPYEPTMEEMNRDNAMVSSLIEGMIKSLCQVQENGVQEIEMMIGGEYGGMTTAAHQWNEGADHDYAGFNPRDIDCNYAYSEIMGQIGTGYFRLKEISGGTGDVFALATIIRVASMLRLSDIYGPMPYSQQDPDKVVVPYDSEKDLYNYLISDLDGAIQALSSLALQGASNTVLNAAGDPVFKGSYNKWVKFANTVKLRMAIRMLYTNDAEAEAKAKEMVTEVVNDPVGPMLLAEDRAVTTSFDKGRNLYAMISNDWGNDCRANANIVYYLKCYNDPRGYLYVTGFPSTPGVLQGAATGTGATDSGRNYGDFAKVNFADDDPQWIMSASEAWFLLAEASLKGCTISGTNSTLAGRDAQGCYEEGVRVSFRERGAQIGDYLEEGHSVSSAAFNDGINDTQDLHISEKAPIQWAGQLSQILTQKFIANFPNGFETWADVRRTGYPVFLKPVSRNPEVTQVSEMRRLRFPQKEYTTNAQNVAAATAMLNGGADKFTTRLWWDND